MTKPPPKCGCCERAVPLHRVETRANGEVSLCADCIRACQKYITRVIAPTAEEEKAHA